MKIKRIENGYAMLQKTRDEEEHIKVTECGIMITPSNLITAIAELKRLADGGMPIGNFLGLLLDDPRGETRRMYLLINDGKSDFSCVEVSA